jgi:hypothetical protein
MTVSRTRKNFSASICVAPFTIASLVLLWLAGFKFNHLSESVARALREIASEAEVAGPGLIGSAASAY